MGQTTDPEGHWPLTLPAAAEQQVARAAPRHGNAARSGRGTIVRGTLARTRVSFELATGGVLSRPGRLERDAISIAVIRSSVDIRIRLFQTKRTFCGGMSLPGATALDVGAPPRGDCQEHVRAGQRAEAFPDVGPLYVAAYELPKMAGGEVDVYRGDDQCRQGAHDKPWQRQHEAAEGGAVIFDSDTAPHSRTAQPPTVGSD